MAGPRAAGLTPARFEKPVRENSVDIGSEAVKVPLAIMNRNVINSVLTGVLAVSLIASVICCFRVVNATRTTRKLAFQVRQIQFEQARIQSLVNECVQYGQSNSAIRPILESVGLTNAAAVKPASK